MIVILSTFNGHSRLGEMLEAMRRVRIPAGTTIHVVDNGSSDGTPDLVAQFTDRLPIVQHFQPVRGKNNCLNFALEKLIDRLDPRELIVFTDDDILPSEGWLEELDASARAHPDCDVFAGSILPHWPCCGMRHLESVRRHFGILFTLTSHSEGPVDCAQAWGPNMAVRASVFQAGYRFDPRFGPNGTAGYPMGSETELMERLDAAGYKAWFVERAYVRHMIRANQTDAVNVVQRAFRHGYGSGLRDQRGRGVAQLMQCRWKSFRGIAASRLRHTWVAPENRLLQDFNEAWARGYAIGAEFEYRNALAKMEFEDEFPERREDLRSHLLD